MMEFFRSWILNIVIVIIFIVFTEMIIPSDKFKKYVKLATGLVLMIMIINPVITLVDEGYSLDKISVESFNTFDNGQLQVDAKRIEDIQNSQIVNTFKENLKKDISTQIFAIGIVRDADVNVDIVEDVKSKDFGTIKKINAQITFSKKSESSSIEKVDINFEEKESSNDDDILKIKEKLSDVYKIEKEKINITTQ